jgi:hypothetical protein
MSEQKIKVSKISILKYLRDFSIVVVGITATWLSDNWITAHSEKKDMNLYLSAIKIELEENFESIQELRKHYERSEEYSSYLLSHDKSLLNEDSLYSYGDVHYSTYNVKFSTSAFEMFKTSGYMRFIADKKFLQSIWNIYDAFATCEQDFNAYSEEKNKSVFVNIKENEAHKKEIEKHTYRTIPMYDFFITYGYGAQYGMMMDCDEISDRIKEVLSKL